jgi:uncharacterized protein involved in type VI secretion and phage assembly
MTAAVLDDCVDERVPVGWGGRFYGVYPGIVTDNQDPDGQGRVRVRLPWAPGVGGSDYDVWARLATLMAGADRGTWFIPDPDDEVLVVFEAGDVRRPYVIGGLWNGRDAAPESIAADNTVKSLTSRNGVKVTLDDRDGQEALTLETPGGQTVTLSDGPGKVEIVDANGNSVTLDSSGVTITSSGTVSVQASTVDVSAGSVTVNAGISKFSGVVQADTVIANAVVGTSYTPGAGNVW